MTNGSQRTPVSALSQEIFREKRAITEAIDGLRILLQEKGMLCKYNEVLEKYDKLLKGNLDERENLYRERDNLTFQPNALAPNYSLTNRLDLDLVPILNYIPIPEAAQARLQHENKNTNKITISEPRLLPRRNDKAWHSLPLPVTNIGLPNITNFDGQAEITDKHKCLQEQNNNNKTAGRFVGRARKTRHNFGRSSTTATQWLPIPEKLKAYPSILEQLRGAHKFKPTGLSTQTNYFAPLWTSQLDTTHEMEDPELINLARSARNDIDYEMQEPLLSGNATQKFPVVTADVNDLDQILGLSQIPIAEVQLSPTSLPTSVKSSPRVIKHVKVEVVVRNFAKSFDKHERAVKVWSIAKQFDKNVVLCPIVEEPLPVLRSENDIRNCLLYKYFKDRVPAKKQAPSVLQGFLVFGITIGENDFVAAMKDWANSYGHDFARTDRTASTVVVGFLIHMSLTTSKLDAEASIRRTKEFVKLGKPEFHLRIALVYGKSIIGGPDKAPAWCIESSSEEVDSVVQLCQTLFTGNNKQFPSSIRGAFYLPTCSLPIGHHARQSYILGQLAYLNSELTVTCYGLQNIRNMVRLQKDPTIQTSLEDVLMSIPAVNGKLFRSVDMTSTDDVKLFLKFDEINLSSWNHRRSGLTGLLKSIVLPEDYSRVFLSEDDLSFSDPWRKVKDGKPMKNVFDIPNASSIAYTAAMLQKLPVIPESIKKRGYEGLVAAPAENLVDLTAGDTPVSSPNHKVQVVEQGVQAKGNEGTPFRAEPQLSTDESTRIDKLEAVVTDHGKQLIEIKASVTNLDGKVHHNHEESKYIFSDFKQVLMDIRSTVGMPSTTVNDVPMHQQDATGSPRSVPTMVSGCYNPTAEKAMWMERINQHEAAVRTARADRSAYELELIHDGADARSIDYRQVAYQRYPSPVMERVPDDIALYY